MKRALPLGLLCCACGAGPLVRVPPASPSTASTASSTTGTSSAASTTGAHFGTVGTASTGTSGSGTTGGSTSGSAGSAGSAGTTGGHCAGPGLSTPVIDVMPGVGTAQLVSGGPGLPLYGIWAVADDDLWAVGASGLVLHGDGASWTEVPSGTSVDLRAVWGSSPDDVWAVGGLEPGPAGSLRLGRVIHWDGTAWTTVRSDARPLRAVWGTGPREVWVAGPDGVVSLWDGAAWSDLPALDVRINATWGASAAHLWVAGDGNQLVRWEGGGWAPVDSTLPAAVDLTGLTGLSDDDVFVIGGFHGQELTAMAHVAYSGSVPINSISSFYGGNEGTLRGLAYRGGRLWDVSHLGILQATDVISTPSRWGGYILQGVEHFTALAAGPCWLWAASEEGHVYRLDPL